MADSRDALTKELGVSELPEDEQDQIIAGFGEVAIKAAIAAVLGRLSEDKREEFARLAEAGDGKALQAFLDDEVPGHEELVGAVAQEELTRFKAAIAE